MAEVARFLRELGTLYRARRMYPRGNEQVRKAAERAAETLSELGCRVRIARLGANLVVENETLQETPSSLLALMEILGARGQEALHIEADVGAEDLEAWVEGLVGGGGETGTGGGLIRAGVVRVEAEPERPEDEPLPPSYENLLPDVQQALGKLSEESPEGLHRAQEVVFAVATHLASGEDLLGPVRALKGHDDYTFTHALNVCVLATALGRRLGVPEERIKALSLAALCHDVGKERIPAELLNKPGALDDGERAIMNAHAQEGAAILLRLRGGVDPLLPVVACQHHLRSDGTGYPVFQGGGPPHPAALLVAVADVYDALRTVRPYRGSWTTERAFSALIQEVNREVLPRRYVATLGTLLELLGEGTRVRLSDERLAEIREPGREDLLCPRVEVEGGTLIDLSPGNGLRVVAVEEQGEAEGG
ncbi:MAG: HD domain-containing protein [Deferrisomatales bacterium]|nr:HD domain-containing protein [Deferrisomatales bacterium]